MRRIAVPFTGSVAASPAYRHRARALWRELRTVRSALETVFCGCHGQLPPAYSDEQLRAEPLDVRVGYDADPALSASW